MPEKTSLQNRIMTPQIIKNSIHEVRPADVTIVRVFFFRPKDNPETASDRDG